MCTLFSVFSPRLCSLRFQAPRYFSWAFCVFINSGDSVFRLTDPSGFYILIVLQTAGKASDSRSLNKKYFNFSGSWTFPGRDRVFQKTKPEYRSLGIFLFFIFFFFHFLLRVNPILIYHRQDPVFLHDSRFFQNFLTYPGGLLEWLSGLLSQFYLFPIVGSLVVLVLLCVVYVLMRLCFDHFKADMTILPVMLLGGMSAYYNHPLSVTLGVIVALGSVLLILKIPNHKPVVRNGVFILLFLTCYYVAGGFSHFFALLCLGDVLQHTNRNSKAKLIASGIILITAAGIPFVAWYAFFQVSLQAAYLALLPFGESYPFQMPVLFFLSIFLILALKQLPKFDLVRTKISSKRFVRPIFLSVVLVAGALLNWFAVEMESKLLLAMDRAARNENWKDVFRYANDKHTNQHNVSVTFLANQALCFEGVLLSNMFRLPQSAGLDGLMLMGAVGLSGTLPNSDFYFRLGHLNEARHWAHEALAAKGETPKILERLIQVNLLLGEDQAARKFVNVLRKVPFQKEPAEQYADLLDFPESFELPAALQKIKSFAPPEDFINNRYRPISDLQKLIHSSPNNRMAVDYYMAWYLLKGRVGIIRRDIAFLKEAGYDKLPRHIQEALLFYMANTGEKEVDLAGYTMEKQIFQRFFHYNQILSKHRGNKRAAVRELAKYHGDTFWFYVMFRMPDAYKQLSPADLD